MICSSCSLQLAQHSLIKVLIHRLHSIGTGCASNQDGSLFLEHSGRLRTPPNNKVHGSSGAMRG